LRFRGIKSIASALLDHLFTPMEVCVVRMSLEKDISLVVVGTVILTVGVLSICAHLASKLNKQRILLWFGLFAAPYGCALVLRTIPIPAWDSQAEIWLVVFGKLIGFASVIPALLLFREFYGSGWRLSSRWILWTYGVAILLVLVMMTLHDDANTIPSPGIALVVAVPVVLLFDRLVGYRPPPIPGRGFMFTGLSIFFLGFSYDHLVNLKFGVIRFTLEPYGFLILIACLGLVVARRVALNEAEWISLTGEMQAARRIQDAILPAEMPALGDCTISARYAPMSSVAGDFYGFPSAPSDSLNVIVADVMGHGVPAALIASMIKVSVFAGAENQQNAAAIISDLNATLCKDAPRQYASAIYVSIDRRSGIGRYASAGHPPPYLRHRKAKQIERLDQSGMLLGVDMGQTYPECLFQLETGDRLLLYSDGLTDPEDAAGRAFGDAALIDFLEASDDLTTEQFATALLEKVFQWPGKKSGPHQLDDITFVVIDFGRVEEKIDSQRDFVKAAGRRQQLKPAPQPVF
jgi:phosphoserine phosphatase RsbU/P